MGFIWNLDRLACHSWNVTGIDFGIQPPRRRGVMELQRRLDRRQSRAERPRLPQTVGFTKDPREFQGQGARPLGACSGFTGIWRLLRDLSPAHAPLQRRSDNFFEVLKRQAF